MRIGENAIIRRFIVAEDGTTAIPIVAGLQSLSVKIIQYNRELASFVLIPTPSPVQTEIRVGPDATNQLEVEITPTVSERFNEGAGDGAVFCKITMEQTNASYLTYGKLKDIDMFSIFDVTL